MNFSKGLNILRNGIYVQGFIFLPAFYVGSGCVFNKADSTVKCFLPHLVYNPYLLSSSFNWVIHNGTVTLTRSFLLLISDFVQAKWVVTLWFHCKLYMKGHPLFISCIQHLNLSNHINLTEFTFQNHNAFFFTSV